MVLLEFSIQSFKHFCLPLSYQTATDGSLQSNNRGAGQSKNKMNTGGNMKNKQTKRAAKRNKYIKKQIQKSI